MKLLAKLKNSRIGSSIQYHIKPRKVKFEWQDTPVDWIPNQPFVSYFINEINIFSQQVNFGSAVYTIVFYPKSQMKN